VKLGWFWMVIGPWYWVETDFIHENT